MAGLARPAFVLVLSALAAGCLAPNDAPEFRTPVCVLNTTDCLLPGAELAVDVNASLFEAPRWEVGDFWTYRPTGQAGDGGSTVTLVVASVGGTYDVRPTDNGTAMRDALDDWSMVGPVGLDLSGEREGTRVRYFSWPLEQNKTWTALVEGRSLRMTAKLEKEVWNVAGVEGNETFLRYTYDPRVKWFTRIRWGPNEDYGFDLAKGGAGYVGPVFSATVTELYRYIPGGAPAATFTVPTGVSGVAVAYAAEVPVQSASTARLVDPKGTVYTPYQDQNCVQAPCQPVRGVLSLPATPGAWEASVTSAGAARVSVVVYDVRDVRRGVA